MARAIVPDGWAGVTGRCPRPPVMLGVEAHGHAGWHALRPEAAIVHGIAVFAPRKLPIFAAVLIDEPDCVDLHDVIWLIVLSTALIMLWGSSDHWDLRDLWRRVGHVLHLDQRADGVDRRR